MTYLQDLTDNELLRSIWAALRRLEERLADPLVNVAAPVVEVPPPDLTDIVTAVLSLNGTGPSAEDIARAIAEVLHFPVPEPDESLVRVAEALERVSNQLKGLSNMGGGGGGGTVYLSKADLDALTGPVAHSTNVYAVAASTSVQTIGSADGGRLAMTVLNEPGSARMFMKFGLGASAENYSNVLGPGDFWESTPPRFSGPVTAVWEAATGRAMVTEFMP